MPCFTISSSASLSARPPIDWLIATPTAYKVFCSSLARSAARAPDQPIPSTAATQNTLTFKMDLFSRKIAIVPEPAHFTNSKYGIILLQPPQKEHPNES